MEGQYKKALESADIHVTISTRPSFYFASYDDATKMALKKERMAFLDKLNQYINFIPDVEKKIAAYQHFQNYSIVTAHRNIGLLALGQTDAQKEIATNIKNLETRLSQNRQQR